MAQTKLTGAWKAQIDGLEAVCIVTDGYFAVTYYQPDDHAFAYTEGGLWSQPQPDQVVLNREFHTRDTNLVGQEEAVAIQIDGDKLMVGDMVWNRLDDGTPGDLVGAWLITGRDRDGEMQPMRRGPRKTMKILSGTRFQWIAYNTETKVFSGTGGGTYTTIDGKYTETIDFFSRDNSRVGAVLPFDYALKDGDWHHSGKSSKGDPIYEVWSQRPLE
jgi:hypothetical protein